MNSVLNINVRVATAQARQAMKAVEGDLKRMTTATNAGASAGNAFNRAFDPRRMAAFGKNLQWTGRQLEFSFTLPLLLAGTAAAKWSLDNQRAMVGVRKVYGDGTESAGQLKAELDALGRSFELLSSRFGVHQNEVIDIAAAWAQAGASGVGLAKSTKLTLETMILGVDDAAKATEGLIGIQSAYRLSTSELTTVVANLNRIENQTGITLGGLIDTISRAGGTAKTAGVSIEQLAAYAAAIVPAAGSAAQAGNSLRTIISRIMAPTKESAELMARMGVNIEDAGWQSQTAVGRIDMLAKAFMNQSDAQKTTISSAIASRWQLNRFDLLMEQVANRSGFYARGLDTATDAQKKFGGMTKAQIAMQKELRVALESDPKKFDQLWNTLRNTMAQTIQPIIPYVIMLLQKITNLMNGFKNLSPQMKQAVTAGLLFLVVLGPLARYIGAVTTLVGTMGTALKWLNLKLLGSATTTGMFSKIWSKSWMVVRDVTRVAMINIAAIIDMSMLRIRTMWAASSGFMVRIWGAMWRGIVTVLGPVGRVLVGAVAAIGKAMNVVWAASIGAMALPPAAMATLVVGAFVLMLAWIEEHVSGGFRRVVQSIGSSLAALPRIMANALVAVSRVVQRAVEVIWDALSYLNPFARHSPSLVDNVIAGVSVILNQFAKLRQIPGSLRSAMSALERFKEATGGRGEEAEFQSNRADIVSVSPQAGPAVDALWETLKRLRVEARELTSVIAHQESVVTDWDNTLAEANMSLESVERTLDDLKRVAETASTALELAKEKLDTLEDIELSGWYAMDEAIFQNEMGVNKLRLALLQMEDAGLGVEDLKNRLSELAGEIEMLQGEAMDLRQAGAGSDVLGPIEAQIALLEQQRSEIERQGSPISKMQEELEQLERQGQILNLERSLQFDPLRRQIDQVGESMTELPFDQLHAQLVEQNAVVDQLETAWKAAEAAVTAQTAVVDQHKAARDAIQTSYDNENRVLGQLKDAYSVVADAIREMESELSNAASSASSMLDTLKDTRSQAEKLFDAGEGFDFPDVGGVTGIEREGGLFDIEQFNKDMEAQLAADLKRMNIKFDIFGPIKDQFVKAWEWIKNNSTRLVLGALAGIALAIALHVTGWPVLIIAAIVMGLNAAFGGRLWEAVKAAFSWVADLLGPFIATTFSFIGDVFGAVFSGIGDALVAVWDGVIAPVLRVMADVWGAVWGGVTDALSAAWRFIEPIFNAIVDFIKAYLVPVFEAWLAIVEIVLTLIGRVLQWVWDTVMRPIFNFIGGAVTDLGGVFKTVFGAIEMLFRNVIAPLISWLWRNVFEPAFNGIGNLVGWLWRTIIEPAFNGIGSIISTVWRNIIQPALGGFESFVRNVLAPVFFWLRDNVIKPVFDVIGTIIEGAWDGITGTIKRLANFFIRAFNFIARGIRAVAKFLNIEVTISEMKEMHRGGLVGDQTGSPHQGGLGRDEVVRVLQKGEYVLDAQTVRRIGWQNIAKLREGEQDLVRPETGGIDVGKWFSDRRENLENIAGAVRKGAVIATAQPFLKAADTAINLIPHEVTRAGARRVKNDMYDWLKGVDEKGFTESTGGNAPIPAGYGGWARITNWLGQQAGRPPYRITSTYRPGDPGRHGMGLAVDLAGTTPGRDSPQLLAIYRALLPIARTLNELIYSGPGGGGFKAGSPHTYNAAVRADHHDHVHAALRNGGIVKARPGGTVIRAGEGGYDEAVVPLPNSWRSESKREVNIYGNLEFPNISNPEDAEQFIRNLEALSS